MLQVHAAVLAVLHALILTPGLQIDPQGGIAHGTWGGKHHLIPLPLLALHLYYLIKEHLVLTHGVVIAQMESDKLLGGRLAFLSERGRTCPYAEPVLLALLYAHSEKTFVLYAAEHDRMAGITYAHIVRAALKRAVITHLHIPECGPPHKRVVKLKGTVLDKLGIQSAVGSIVYILKEQAVHGLLNRNLTGPGINLKRRLGLHQYRYADSHS